MWMWESLFNLESFFSLSLSLHTHTHTHTTWSAYLFVDDYDKNIYVCSYKKIILERARCQPPPLPPPLRQHLAQAHLL